LADFKVSGRCGGSDGSSAAVRRAAVLALAVCTLTPAALAQPGLPGVRGAGSGLATRIVSIYLDRERGLQEALEQGQRAAAAAFLADEFTLRKSASEDVESGDDWLRREFASTPSKGLVRDLSVREVDDVAVVSFLLDRGPAGRRTASTWFVVDVWRQSTQRLLSRSMTRAVGTSTKPNRPSGKE
jgi:hypothetical protein